MIEQAASHEMDGSFAPPAPPSRPWERMAEAAGKGRRRGGAGGERAAATTRRQPSTGRGWSSGRARASSWRPRPAPRPLRRPAAARRSRLREVSHRVSEDNSCILPPATHRSSAFAPTLRIGPSNTAHCSKTCPPTGGAMHRAAPAEASVEATGPLAANATPTATAPPTRCTSPLRRYGSATGEPR